MKYSDLIKQTDEQIIELYDKAAEHTSVGLGYYMEEMARRRAEKLDNRMLNLTTWMAIMTAVMLFCTIINVFFSH